MIAEKILFPTDFSKVSEAAFEHAMSLTRETGAMPVLLVLCSLAFGVIAITVDARLWPISMTFCVAAAIGDKPVIARGERGLGAVRDPEPDELRLAILAALRRLVLEVCDNDEIIFGDLNDPHSKVREVLQGKFTIRRRPGLGTNPQVFYIV